MAVGVKVNNDTILTLKQYQSLEKLYCTGKTVLHSTVFPMFNIASGWGGERETDI